MQDKLMKFDKHHFYTKGKMVMYFHSVQKRNSLSDGFYNNERINSCSSFILLGSFGIMIDSCCKFLCLCFQLPNG